MLKKYPQFLLLYASFLLKILYIASHPPPPFRVFTMLGSPLLSAEGGHNVFFPFSPLSLFLKGRVRGTLAKKYSGATINQNLLLKGFYRQGRRGGWHVPYVIMHANSLSFPVQECKWKERATLGFFSWAWNCQSRCTPVCRDRRRSVPLGFGSIDSLLLGIFSKWTGSNFQLMLSLFRRSLNDICSC